MTNTQLEELQAQRAQLAAIVESAHDAIVGHTFDGMITSWNDSATRMFGYPEREALGRSVFLIHLPDRRREMERAEADVMRGERVAPFESICVTKGGRRLPVMIAVSPMNDAASRIVGYFTIYRDLTDVKRAEGRFRAAVESSPNGMVMVDGDGRIVLVNKEMERLFAYAREELLGEPIEKLVPESYRDRHPDFRLAFAARPEMRPMGAGRELYGLRKDGSEVPVEIGLTPVATEEGLFVIAAIVDISLRKHAERLRDESQRKDRFLAVLSHELRGPLASLRVCVNLLLTQELPSGRVREAADIADRQLEHLASVVDQLLDASRIAGGKIVLDRTNRDLGEVVRTSAADQRAVLGAANVELVLQLPREPVWVNCDQLRLSQIVANLLGNAAKFSPQGGQAVVTVRRDDERHLAELSVRDEGIGIDPELLPALFHRFTHVDHGHDREVGGLGLGLVLVHALVEAHGGTVEARSGGRDRGAEFIVRLPLARTAPGQR